MKNFDRLHLLVLLMLFLLMHLFLFWHYGIRSFQDASAFILVADQWLEAGTLEDPYVLFYGVPIGLMTVFRGLFPTTIIPFIVFQCILSGIAALALYTSASVVFNSRVAGLMAAAIFILWVDNIHWNITAMTESIARSLICFIIYCMAHWRGRKSDYVFLTFFGALLLFTRPTGVVVIGGGVTFLLSYHWKSLIRRPVILVSVLSLTAILSFFCADVMFRNWDLIEQNFRGNIITYADLIEGTPLFHESLRIDRPTSTSFAADPPSLGKVFRFIYENPIHFLKAACLKIFYLVSFTRPYYSFLHNFYSIIWVTSMYLFFFLGWKRTDDLPIKLFVLASIILNCILIGTSTVDWDNRFYIPMEPGIILLSSGGADFILKRIKSF